MSYLLATVYNTVKQASGINCIGTWLPILRGILDTTSHQLVMCCGGPYNWGSEPPPEADCWNIWPRQAWSNPANTFPSSKLSRHSQAFRTLRIGILSRASEGTTTNKHWWTNTFKKPSKDATKKNIRDMKIMKWNDAIPSCFSSSMDSR